MLDATSRRPAPEVALSHPTRALFARTDVLCHAPQLHRPGGRNMAEPAPACGRRNCRAGRPDGEEHLGRGAQRGRLQVDRRSPDDGENVAIATEHGPHDLVPVVDRLRERSVAQPAAWELAEAESRRPHERLEQPVRVNAEADDGAMLVQVQGLGETPAEAAEVLHAFPRGSRGTAAPRPTGCLPSR